jgi:hypothetical protein
MKFKELIIVHLILRDIEDQMAVEIAHFANF